MTFRRSNQKPRAKKSHVMEHIFLSPVKKLEEQPKIREIHVHDMVYHMFHLSEILSGPLIIHDLSPAF
jgi:hypothetical protein